MKIVVGEWFRLPWVGNDVYRKLVSEAGLKHDKAKGFQATSDTDLDAVASILGGMLREEVEVSLKCFVCGGSVECGGCGYVDICRPSAVSQACVCRGCGSGEEASTLYYVRFAELAER